MAPRTSAVYSSDRTVWVIDYAYLLFGIDTILAGTWRAAAQSPAHEVIAARVGVTARARLVTRRDFRNSARGDVGHESWGGVSDFRH